MSCRLKRDKSCMTCLRKSTTLLYIAYIKFTVFILPRYVLISFLGAHLTLHLTFLTFALGIQGCIENMKSRIHSSLVCLECINFHTSYFRLISVPCLPPCSVVWCSKMQCPLLNLKYCNIVWERPPQPLKFKALCCSRLSRITWCSITHEKARVLDLNLTCLLVLLHDSINDVAKDNNNVMKSHVFLWCWVMAYRTCDLSYVFLALLVLYCICFFSYFLILKLYVFLNFLYLRKTFCT